MHVDTVSEPGDSIADTTPLQFGDQVSAVLAGGRVDPSTDADYFRIVTTKPTYVYIRSVSDSVDIDGALLNSVGTEVSADIYETTFWSSTKGFTLRTRLATGTHFIRVDIADDMGTGPYTVQMLEDTSHRDTVTDCTAISATFGDPLSGCQWHLDNTGQLNGTAGEDINVDEVWTGGNRGAGVNVVVVDNGLDYLHEDLSSNVNTDLNHDYTGLDLIYHDNSHGTNVAGIIAARGNTIGVRGVAPRATVYGYNVLRSQTDENFSNAVTRNMATTHISNNSWGALEGPGLDTAESFWERAVESGITEGLEGKGVFYVWSAGNGAGSGDNSNLEEVANFYGITAVCAVNNQGERSGYSEEGANLWICAPSSDGSRGRITTTTNFNAYTDSFGGTSAAAPMVSGVAALIRAANSDLTWRDVKLILAASARKNDSANTGWKEGADKYGSTGKYHFNHEYGFGVVDAKAAVDLATGWTNLPEFAQETADSRGGSLTIPDNQTAVTSAITMGSEVQFIEFVEINTAFRAPDFRDLEVELESPSGAVSTLTVPYDRGDCALWFERFLVSCGLTEDFRFGSARHLGENPAGEWTLRITDKQSGGTTSRLNNWSLTVYGHRNSPGRPAVSLIPGDGILTVNWDPPSNTGTSSITGYDVRYIESDATDKSDGEWTVEHRTAASRSYTIPNVTNHTKYDVQVRAVNSNSNGLWSPVSEGTPVPNTDPYFEEGDYADRLIPENSDAGTDVGRAVEAIDTDGDTLTYSLSGADARYFDFDSGTGQISVADGTALDADTRDSYLVTVSVRDSKTINDVADTRTDDTITVDIKVEDLDERPVIEGETEVFYTENGSAAIGPYTGRDPEGDPIQSWDIMGRDDHLFDYALTNNVLSLNFRTSPDYEDEKDDNRDNTYEVTVRASDGTLTGELGVKVMVTNVNEPHEITGWDDIDHFENDSGSVAAYTVTDQENAMFDWDVSGADRGDFTIGEDGELRFAVTPDYESRSDANPGQHIPGDGGGLRQVHHQRLRSHCKPHQPGRVRVGGVVAYPSPGGHADNRRVV